MTTADIIAILVALAGALGAWVELRSNGSEVQDLRARVRVLEARMDSQERRHP